MNNANKPHRAARTSRLFGQFHGICAVCPNGSNAQRSYPPDLPIESRLPPRADRAIAALAECRHLTPRELEILTLCCRGLKNHAIAAVLAISPSAVRRHLRNLHRKTGTDDKAELILNLWHSCGAIAEPITSKRAKKPLRPAGKRARAPRSRVVSP